MDCVTQAFGKNGLLADVEGVTIYYMAGGMGYIIAASQGNNTCKVYRRLKHDTIFVLLGTPA